MEQIKLYTKDECSAIDGIWHANGECTKKEGGSHSWDNRTKSVYTVQIKSLENTIEYKTSSPVSITVKDLSGNLILKTPELK